MAGDTLFLFKVSVKVLPREMYNIKTGKELSLHLLITMLQEMKAAARNNWKYVKNVLSSKCYK